VFNRTGEGLMKIVLPGAGALLLIVACGWMQPAQAQGVPQGSYLGSCTNVSARRDALAATCRKTDGREQRSQINGYRRCVGDIGNDNGVLRCNFPGGPVWGQVTERPGSAPAPYGAPPPGYGYRDQSGPSHWERCQQLDRRVDELRYRRDQTYDPEERSRIDYRLRRTRDERRREGCR
jgi:hypothetical protein